MEKFVWICSSLFVDRELWHGVLRNGVKKFVKENTAGKLEGFKLSFNYLSGANIRLACKVDHLQADKLTSHLDTYFKKYLCDIAPPKMSTDTGNGIFMAMPPYSVKYGLYQVLPFSLPNISDVETGLSNCIIDALSDTEVDADSLLTLGFYLHVALINEYLQLFSTQRAIDILYGLSGPADGASSDLLHQKNYLECGLLLEEVFNQLRYASEEAAPGWILSWSATCKATLEQSDLVGSKKLLNHLRNIIDDQLGLDQELKGLLNYFIKQIYRSKSDL